MKKDEFAALTLNNMGHHKGGAAVVAGQTSGGEVLLHLEGKQVPGGDGTRLKHKLKKTGNTIKTQGTNWRRQGTRLKHKEPTEGDREHI